MKAKYIPNILSCTRIAVALAFAAVFIWLPDRLYIALALFVVSGITDVADGMLARRFGWITEVGKVLDPLADKLMQIIALLCTGAAGLIPLWLIIVAVFKETVMALGSLIFFRKFKEVGVSKNYGKAYTVLFYIVIASVIAFDDIFINNEWVKYALCIATALCGVAAIVLYYITYLKGKLIKAERKQTPDRKD